MTDVVLNYILLIYISEDHLLRITSSCWINLLCRPRCTLKTPFLFQVKNKSSEMGKVSPMGGTVSPSSWLRLSALLAVHLSLLSCELI